MMLQAGNGRGGLLGLAQFRRELEDGRPALDEILASRASIHLEQMAHNAWWMGIEAGGKYFHLNFRVSGGRLHVNLSDQGEEYADWDGDSRKRTESQISPKRAQKGDI